MEEVGDAVLAELKDSLGLALPRPPLPEMSTDNKDKYLAMARTMSDNTKRKTSETMSIGKALSETCPGVSYECFNYANKPENNSCAMVPLDPKSGILKTYSFN